MSGLWMLVSECISCNPIIMERLLLFSIFDFPVYTHNLLIHLLVTLQHKYLRRIGAKYVKFDSMKTDIWAIGSECMHSIVGNVIDYFRYFCCCIIWYLRLKKSTPAAPLIYCTCLFTRLLCCSVTMFQLRSCICL